MMKSLSAVVLAWLLGAAAVEACTPQLPPYVRFEAGSATVPADRVEPLRALALPAKSQPPKCLTYDLKASVDPRENALIAVKRLEAVKQVLQAGGVGEEQIVAKVEPDPSAAANPMAGSVIVITKWTFGEWRCDPASHNPNASSAACQRAYGRCYLQLSDGTVCNPENAPNPNPVTYSVIH
jgi:hypothetical protein